MSDWFSPIDVDVPQRPKGSRYGVEFLAVGESLVVRYNGTAPDALGSRVRGALRSRKAAHPERYSTRQTEIGIKVTRTT